jgi:hypothetical protein
MTLSDLADLSEIIGAIGVIASLIYVGFELRRNTLVLRAQAQETMVSGYMTSIDQLSSNAAVIAKGFKSSPEEFAQFSDADKLIYFTILFGFFKHFEQMYVHYSRGLIDEEEWSRWSEHLLTQFHQPGVQWWWAMRKFSFVKPFQYFLDNSTAPKSTSLVELMEKAEKS